MRRPVSHAGRSELIRGARVNLRLRRRIVIAIDNREVTLHARVDEAQIAVLTWSRIDQHRPVSGRRVAIDVECRDAAARGFDIVTTTGCA